MREELLKPCPFCGGQAHIAWYAAEFVRNAADGDILCVECEQCGIQTLPDTEDNLIRFWNTRYTG